MKAEEHKERVGRWEIHIVGYRLDKEWVCTVDNVSPGANIARATGKTREETEELAVGKAKERLAQTRVQKTRPCRRGSALRRRTIGRLALLGPPELRLALFHEGAHVLLVFGGRVEMLERQHLELDRRLKRPIP
jgi:hypothetical protein